MRPRLAEARGEAEARVDQDAAQPLTEGGDDTGQQVQHYARTARKEGRSGDAVAAQRATNSVGVRPNVACGVVRLRRQPSSSIGLPTARYISTRRSRLHHLPKKKISNQSLQKKKTQTSSDLDKLGTKF